MKQDRSLHTQQTVLLLIASFVLGAVATPAISYAEYIWGEAWATEATDPEHMGYWEYCISMGWDMSDYSEGAHGASHVSLLLELEDCLADCGEACFAFEDTVGTGHGVEGCEVYFYAELDIKGDPTVPAESPTLKFEPYPDACEPDVKGTAYFCFYSLMPPEEDDPAPASVWVKFGPYTEKGMVTGKLPSCGGTVPTDFSTWSSIKRLFR